MAPLPAPAEKPSHRVSDSQSHAKVRPPTQVAVFCAALWPNLQPALTIAQAQAMAGDNRGALATARRTVSGRDAALANLCEVQCWESNVREAVATALEIVSAGGRSEALVEIARHRVRGGDIGGAAQPIALAVEVAEAIKDAGGRAQALARIAATQLDAITD